MLEIIIFLPYHPASYSKNDVLASDDATDSVLQIAFEKLLIATIL